MTASFDSTEMGTYDPRKPGEPAWEIISWSTFRLWQLLHEIEVGQRTDNPTARHLSPVGLTADIGRSER